MSGVFEGLGQSVGGVVGGTSSGVVTGLPGGLQGAVTGGELGALGGAAGGAAAGAVGGLGVGDVVTVPGGALTGAVGGGFIGSAAGAATGFAPGFADGYAQGAPAGAAIGGGYGQSLDQSWLGRKINAMVKGNEKADKAKTGNQTNCSGSCAAADDANAKKKVDTKAADKYKKDPDSLRGRDPKDVEQELDKTLEQDGGWTKDALADGNGVRYTDGKGGSVQVNEGYPDGLQQDGGDLVHQGPYVKISNGGPRIPLAGNPSL